MTVLLECFVRSVCVLLEYFSGALHIKVWVSIIWTFRLSEHTQVPTRPDKRGSTILLTESHSLQRQKCCDSLSAG